MKTTNTQYSKYFTVTGKAKLNYGTTLYKVGTAVAIKGNFVGPIELYIGAEKMTEGQYFDVEVLIDGVVVDAVRYLSTTKKAWSTVCYVPTAGEHTITLQVVGSSGVPSDNGEYSASVFMNSAKLYTEIIKHTVTFEGDGVAVDPQTIAAGSTATEPTTPVRAGYTFAGWLLEGERYDFTAPVNADITLTASWISGEQCTVTFEGEGVDVDPQFVTQGGTATEPAAPAAREGYTFEGWLLNGTVYDFATPVNGNITLVASWKVKEYTVTFKLADGTTVKTATVAHGASAQLPTSTSYYYEFSPANALYKITENKTVVLTPVAKTGYTSRDISARSTNTSYADYMATTGTCKNYSTLLWKPNQQFTFTADMMGPVEIKFQTFNVSSGQSITYEILMDGVVVNEYYVDSTKGAAWTLCAYVPNAGEHTITVRVKSMVGVTTYENWGTALGVNDVRVCEANN